MPLAQSRHSPRLMVRLLGRIIPGAALIASCTGAPELPREASTGPAIYAHLCQKCHGKDGWGDGPQAQWQYLPPANFHAPASRSKSDGQLLSVIEHGVIFSPMHAYRDTLTDAQMQDVLAHIRVLSQRRR
jgi:mono/diheme cytochrome c family protein